MVNEDDIEIECPLAVWIIELFQAVIYYVGFFAFSIYKRNIRVAFQAAFFLADEAAIRAGDAHLLRDIHILFILTALFA